MNNPQLTDYIFSQVKAGVSVDDIAAQLRNSNWPEADIQAGFAAVQQLLNPAPPVEQVPVQASQPLAQPVTQVAEQSAQPTQTAQPTQPQVQQRQVLPAPLQKGRMRIGWQLFKQSLAIIKANPDFWKYMVRAVLVTTGIYLLLLVVAVVDMLANTNIFTHEVLNSSLQPTTQLTIVGDIVGLITILVCSVVSYYYAVGLSSEALQLFRGKQTSFAENMAVARKKLPAIIVFALINATLGWVLRQIEERFRLVGLIIRAVVGAAWALATTFVVPLLADTNDNGARVIKDSLTLFKKTWGETITSRVSLGGFVFLLIFLVVTPIMFILALVMTTLLGWIGFFITAALYFIIILVVSVAISLTSHIVNTALYYYATYGIIPPAFSPELLASVFYDRKAKK